MRKVKITVTRPIIDALTDNDPNQKDLYGLEFFATSYRILSRFDGIEDPSAILAQSIKNQVELDEKVFELDFPEDRLLYVTTKHHFRVTSGPDMGNEVETEWSSIVPVSKYDNRLKVSDVMVSTPSVFFREEAGTMFIETSKFKMYAGPGTHASTTWRIEDSTNNPLYERNQDEDNLTYFEAPFEVKSGKLYMVKARHTSTTGGNSNYGVEFFNNYSANTTQFEIQVNRDFISWRKYHYRIKLWTTDFLFYRLEVVDKTLNKTVIDLQRQTVLSQYILHGYEHNNPEFLHEFEFYLTVTYKYNDMLVESERTLVHSDTMGVNQLYPYDLATTYTEMFHRDPDLITNGINCSTFRETFDNKFLAVDFIDGKIWLYKNNNGTLIKYKPVYEFPYKIDIHFCNIVQLSNGSILVDVCMYDDNTPKGATFLIFDYNPFREELILEREIVRYDERQSTAISNSLSANGRDEVWYVPSYLTDGITDDRQNLKLRRLNCRTWKVDKDIELPFVAKYNVTCICDKDDNVFVIGGSAIPRYVLEREAELDNKTQEETFQLDNTLIYKLIRQANEDDDFLERWAVMPEVIPNYCYSWQPFLRVDGQIVLFNSAWSGEAINYNKHIVFHPYTKQMSIHDLNGAINMPFRTNFVFRSGNIRRVSSLPQAEQYAITYISNTMLQSTINRVDIYDTVDDLLVVGSDETVVVEDIYRYKDIRIMGNGILKWVRPQAITILTSKDLIINRDRQSSLASLNAQNYRSILVLDGSQFTVM